MQFDFTLPRRFGLEYIAEDGKQHQPLMVHRALYGSIERFFGILIEHYAGAFPVWLAPVQAIVLNITDRQNAYAKEIYTKLKTAGFRVELDDRNEKVNFKIREAQLPRFPTCWLWATAKQKLVRWPCAIANTEIRALFRWMSLWPG